MDDHFATAIQNGLGKRKDLPLRVIGIDLGTTNCSVAEVVVTGSADETLEPHCLDISQETASEGEYFHILLPSVVALYNGREFVGEGAKRLRARIAEKEFGLERNRTIFWEVKNEMGIRRSYARAPEGYRSAAEVSGRILRFLANQYREGSIEPSRTVVTVPASFQQAQREDTRGAADMADIELTGGDLLDEPLAAFVDFWMRGELAKALPAGEGNVLVFDFGGGTCDTAVVRVHPADASGQLRVSPLSVSRYYRLGGGDIDLAIFYEVLLPQIIEQNALSESDVDYDIKKQQLEPAFLSVAEQLKVGLCTQVRRLKELSRSGDLPIEPVQKLPGVHLCKLKDGREIKLQSPALTLPQFKAVLEPFLDRTFVFHRETEYRLTCSIFAPLQDALDRAELTAEEINCCLMVGGSSLIPQVADAVREFFGAERVVTYSHPDHVQSAVARGAAIQALSLAVLERGVVQAASPTGVCIRTSKGKIQLIPPHSPLPFPTAGEWAMNTDLSLPKRLSRTEREVRIELVGADDSLIQSWSWHVPKSAKPGESLLLQYCMDENQLIGVRIDTESGTGPGGFSKQTENPIHNVVNPDSKRIRILELEEQMRTRRLSPSQQEQLVIEIANLNRELHQYDRARHLFEQVLRSRGGGDVEVLNYLGIVSGEQRDHVAEEKFYKEAARLGSDAAQFNLALCYRARGLLAKAAEVVERAIESTPKAPYLVLRADIAAKENRMRESECALNEAKRSFGPVKSLDDWELGWYEHGAGLAGDESTQEIIRAEKKRRRRSIAPEPSGLLPEKREA